MNFLAHAYLSHHNTPAILGGFLGDFVKGNLREAYNPAVRTYIQLHRHIDSYTDSHPLVTRSKQLVSAQRRRYAGIMVDVFFDHFLARHWSRYSAMPLHAFTREIYAVLKRHRHELPENLQRILPHMAGNDWLASYADLDSVHAAVNGIARRLRYQNNLNNGAQELADNYFQYEKYFLGFFPELMGFVEQTKAQD